MTRVVLFASLAVALAGCGGGDSCSRGSPCPNDQMRTPSQVTECRATLDANKNANCFREVVAYSDCISSNIVCTSGGTTDVDLTTTKAANNCKNQFDAASSCCASNAGSTACQ
ncbi:MAG: hypothetical protein IPJ65_29505 [Archangiaceae bacterium]|nr:hypothetical protein [Archangiaceae bacterium]